MTTALYIGLLFGVIGLSAFIKIGTIVLKSSNLRPSQHSVVYSMALSLIHNIEYNATNNISINDCRDFNMFLQQTSVQRNRNRRRNDSSSESSTTNAIR